MVIVQLTDGLGNQLFQYAAARRLAHRLGTVLKLDLFAYAQSTFRQFCLDRFNITAQIASWQDIARLCPNEAVIRGIRLYLPQKVRSMSLKALNKVGLQSPYSPRTREYDFRRPLPSLVVGHVASERFFHFDPELLFCPDNVCLTGFWQTEKYFRDISEVLKRELQVKAPIAGKNAEFARQIRSTNSVSLHVRRGDKTNIAHHCATTVDFCSRAMEIVRGKILNPKIFIFTDDWEWVTQNIPEADDVIYVQNNDVFNCHEDLRLMSLCKHNIIASSSFSWWAAWLNANQSKIVIAPEAWTRIDNHDSSDVFPQDWLKIA